MPEKVNDKLISDLLLLLNDEDKLLIQRMISCLRELGCVPQKLKTKGYVLSFKNGKTKQAMANTGLREGADKAFISIKFFAARNPPAKFSDAVQNEIDATSARYRCIGCDVCGCADGEKGYPCVSPDGEEMIRCGVYVVTVPELALDDLDDVRRMLQEQHEYYLSRAK